MTKNVKITTDENGNTTVNCCEERKQKQSRIADFISYIVIVISIIGILITSVLSRAKQIELERQLEKANAAQIECNRKP